MAVNSGRMVGIVAIVLSIISGVGGILYYTSRHTRRGLVLLIGFGLLLVFGIILIVISGRKPAPTQE